jgi:release factor glutamine methyltransferase
VPDLLLRGQGQLAWAAEVLRAAAVPEPRREATRLRLDVEAAAAAGCWNEPGGPAMSGEERFRLAVEQRASGAPRQYASRVAGFRHLLLRADARALIPRPETEGLVDLALRLAPRGRALDLGTGGGCVALALAAEGSYDEVVGVDRSTAALALARENAALCGLRVQWVEGDWVSPVRGAWFDLVVSNPPYLTSGELVELESGVRAWEPALALDGGPDGLGPTERLLRDVPRVLAPGGVFLLELDCRRARASVELAVVLGWTDVTVIRDLFGRDRYLTARREPPS